MMHPKHLLKELEQKARRRFGQHFLWDEDIVARIVRGAKVHPGDQVVEIGPGLGVLTEQLVETGANVTAIELDRDLAEYIRKRFPMVHLLEADAARVNWADVVPQPPAKVVANLPYNVGTKVVMQMLKQPGLVSEITVMLQAEVVARFMAGPGSKTYGSLSVRSQVRAQPIFLMAVAPTHFYPPPKVQSSVVRFIAREKPDFGGVEPQQFDRVVAGCFAQRRKTVVNSLGALLHDRVLARRCLTEAGVDTKARAEALSIEEYRRLAASVVALEPQER